MPAMVGTKGMESHFPHMLAHPHIPRSTSHTDLSAKPAPAAPKAKSGTSSPTEQKRPPLPHSKSHPGPAPKSKPPRPAFGTNYRVRRSPVHSPPNQHPSHGKPLNAQQAGSVVRDFAPSTAAHTQPARRKPVYSWHEADPATKERHDNTLYTEEELLKRLNTIGEDNEEEMDRVRTVERERERQWEEERKRKEDREMEEWNRRAEKKKIMPGKMVRGFSWKGMKQAVGFEGKK